MCKSLVYSGCIIKACDDPPRPPASRRGWDCADHMLHQALVSTCHELTLPLIPAACADGDEEVGAAGPCVAGVVLTQDLPHLSHLGERTLCACPCVHACQHGWLASGGL